MTAAFAVTALLTEDFLALNRVVGIVRRRNIEIASLTVGAAHQSGLVRVTLVARTDPGSADRMARQLRKMVGVIEVQLHPEETFIERELVLIRVRTSGARAGQILDTVERFNGRVADEGPDEILIEAAGDPPFVLSLIRALEPFGVLEVARSGSVAVGRALASGAFSAVASPLPAAQLRVG
jgi:acetolactate synthase-1/3 small subunit